VDPFRGASPYLDGQGRRRVSRAPATRGAQRVLKESRNLRSVFSVGANKGIILEAVATFEGKRRIARVSEENAEKGNMGLAGMVQIAASGSVDSDRSEVCCWRLGLVP
jgi:hypothetical protein